MALIVKLVLPGNYKNSYLQEEFINDGNLYVMGDGGKATTLTFGFQILDSITQETVDINRVVSLEISNDEAFGSDSVCTISDWPSGGSYSGSTDYTVTIDPDNPNTGQVFTTAAGNGLFNVVNWPLSGNGGLSTVFFRVTLEAANTGLDQVVYPGHFSIFDQILWQNERPTAPGKPSIVNNSGRYVGKRALWRFNASEEPSTGLYNAGVSRYIADLIEIRDGQLYSVRSGGPWRTLMPSFIPAEATLNTPLTATGFGASSYSYSHPENSTYTSNANVIGTTYNLTNSSAIGFKTAQISTGTTNPDWAGQTFFTFGSVVIPGVAFDIIAKAFVTPLSSGLGSADEVGVAISVNNDLSHIGQCKAKMFRISGGAIVSSNEIILPAEAYAFITNSSGGNIELYVNNYTRPYADHQMIATAYYTPYQGKESIRLGSIICSNFAANSNIGMTIELCAHTTLTNLSPTLATVSVKEMAMGTGAIQIGMDAGDCSVDRFAYNPESITLLDINWNTFASQSMLLTETPSGDNDANTTIDTSVAGYALMKAKKPTTSVGRDYCELHSLAPTFSDRFRITVSPTLSATDTNYPNYNNGDFYVAISPMSSMSSESTRSDGTHRPMGVRCDTREGVIDSGVNQATLAFIFSPPFQDASTSNKSMDGSITLVQRREDGTLTSYRLQSKWTVTNGSPPYFYFIEIDNSYKSDGSTETVVKFGQRDFTPGYFVENLYTEKIVLVEPITAAQAGFGYYTAFGVRSGDYDAKYRVDYFAVMPLPPLSELSGNDLPHQRHFIKENGAALYDTSLLGQVKLAGQIDFKGYAYETPVAYEEQVSARPVDPYTFRVRAASTANVASLSGPQTIDGYALVADDYVLLKDQTTASQNGVYQVKAGAWVAVTLGTVNRTLVRVRSGTVNKGSEWMMYPNSTDSNNWIITTKIAPFLVDYFAHVSSIGSNITLSGPMTLDGYVIKNNDLVLVKDQTDPTENGLYIAHTGGAWTLTTHTFLTSDYIYVLNGDTNKETLWYVDTTSPLKFGSTLYAQSFKMTGINSLNTSMKPQLFEALIACDSLFALYQAQPKIRIHADSLGNIGAALTDWVDCEISTVNPISVTGADVPGNAKVQFDLSSSGWTVTSNADYWFVLNVGPGYKLGSANAPALTNNSPVINTANAGWNIVNDLWFQLFAKYAIKKDNLYNMALLQLRMSAEAHGYLPSITENLLQSNASTLSDTIRVDVGKPGNVSKTRPAITTYLEPSMRSVALTISAIDSSDTDFDGSIPNNPDFVLDTDDLIMSDVKAFRILHEMPDGSLKSEPWQPWAPYETTYKTAQYVTYLYGNSPQDTSTCKLWVQVMDGVGNITESYPIVVLNRAVALLDTVPPSGTIRFVNTAHEDINASNDSLANLALTAYDRVSGVKDARVRGVNIFSAQSFDKWTPFNEILLRQLSTQTDGLPTSNGLRRVELQLRDYGNNASQVEPIWSVLYETAGVNDTIEDGQIKHKGVSFVAATKWIPPSKTSANLYLSGIQHEEFGINDNYVLVDAQDSAYIASKAYKIVCKESGSGSYGRVIYARDNDEITVFKNNSIYTDFTIDSNRGLIVFDSQQTAGDSFTVQILRNSAILCVWDGVMPVKVAELGHIGERVVLSMVGIDGQYLALGGESGNIWLYDGRTISGPAYTAKSNTGQVLPVNLLFSAQFAHESEPYIYAGTGITPRLFRVPQSGVVASASWKRVQPSGVTSTYLSSSQTSGDLLSAAVAYNTIFLGTSSGKVLKYTRRLQYTNSTTEVEALTESLFSSSYVGDFEGASPSIASLLTIGNQVMAGLGDRPEVWSYSQTYADAPEKFTWNQVVFDKNFVFNPAPAQFYTNSKFTGTLGALPGDISVTNPSDNLLISWNLQSDKTNSTGFKDSVTILSSGTGVSQYTWDAGSDFESVMSGAFASATTGTVRLAATSSVSATSGVKVIDGITVSNGDRVLVTAGVGGNLTLNGIYVVNTSGAWALASDTLYQNYNIYVTEGTSNIGTYFVLTDVTNKVWNPPQYMIETDMMSMVIPRSAANGKQGISICDGKFQWDVQVSKTGITLTSGSNTATAAFSSYQGPFSMMSGGQYGGQIYTQFGYSKLWSFGASDHENTGPYWSGAPGGASGDTTNEGWAIDRYVNSLTIATQSETTSTLVATESYLNAALADTGSPRIVWRSTNAGQSPISVNTQSKFFIRVAFTINATATIENLAGKIKVSWSNNASETNFEHWTEATIAPIGGHHNASANPYEFAYQTYVLEPAWSGSINSLALEFEFEDAGQDTRQYIDNAYIDYMAVANDGFGIAFLDTLTQLRVCVNGRRVQVYAGRYENPLIDQPLFLSRPSTQYQVKLGDIDASETTPSAWAFTGYKFQTGVISPPVTSNIRDFAVQSRFPSTGGVRKLLAHQGTAWALTDGLNTNIATDNPDDRTSKCFSYNASKELWTQESPPYPRLSDGFGVIRPLCAASYYSTLVVGTQIGKVETALPTRYRELNPLPPPNLFSGLGMQSVEYNSDITKLKALGVSWVRHDMRWASVESSLGVYNWTSTDLFVNTCLQNGLRILFILDYSNTLYGVADEFTPPTTGPQRTGFVNFVKAAVQRYQGIGCIWEIWNEPNVAGFWKPTPNVSDYMTLTEAVVAGIRSVAPDEWIAGPAANSYINDPFLENCMAAGALDLWDIVSVHTYPLGRPSDQLPFVYAKIRSLISTYNTNDRDITIISSEGGMSTLNAPVTSIAPSAYSANLTGVQAGINLVTYTEDFSNANWNAYWQKPTVTYGKSDPLGTSKATEFASSDYSTSDYNAIYNSGVYITGTLVANHYYNVSVYLRSTESDMLIRFGLADSAAGTGVHGYTEVKATTTWQRFNLVVKAASSGTHRVFEVWEATPSNQAWQIAFPQVEDVSSVLGANQTLQDAAYLVLKQEAQADMLTDYIQAQVDNGIGLSILYEYKDQATGSTDVEMNYGVLYHDGTNKPSYTAIKSLYDANH